jgi:hypothetical protein
MAVLRLLSRPPLPIRCQQCNNAGEGHPTGPAEIAVGE